MKRMERRFRCLLCLLLCGAMLFGMLPGMQASAAEVETAGETPAVETPVEEPAETESPTGELPEEEYPEGVSDGEPSTEEIPEEEVPETETELVETTAPEVPEEKHLPEEILAEEEPIDEDPEEDAGEEIEETLDELNALSIGEDENGNITFATFEDLKILAAGTYSEQTMAQYVGEGPLEIKENMALPQNLQLTVGQPVIVPAGVTFLLESDRLYAEIMVIDGSMIVTGGLHVKEALTVNGVLEIHGYGMLENNAILTGGENIRYSETAKLFCNYEVATFSELQDAVEVASNADSHWEYDLCVGGQADIVVNSSLAIPSNCNLTILEGAVVTVAAGSVLEVNGHHSIYGLLVVNGTLINNKQLWIIYNMGGKLVISEGGTVSGSGPIHIYSNSLTEPDDAVPGLDLTNYQVTKDNQAGNFSWVLRNVNGLVQLGTPTDLRWGYNTEWKYNYETGKNEVTLVERPGFICWKPVEPFQGHAAIQILKSGQDTSLYYAEYYFGSTEIPEWIAVNDFIRGDYESGTYYFTVTSSADGTAYGNSVTATSDTWTYTKPEAKLEGCRNPSWNWPYAEWTSPENAGGYEVEFYYEQSENRIPRRIGGAWSTWGLRNETEIFDSYVQENGDGYYYFRVRALSPDITQYQNGPWSELSEPYCLTAATESVNSELDEIIRQQTDPEGIKAAVQAIDTEELRSAMLADQSNSGTIAKLEELESKVGSTVVEVTDSASAFDQSKISIVGASLNEVVDEAQDVKLIVDKPATDHVLDAQYDNSVAVSFSMGLENVEDAENLTVPVKITLPVPSSINPSFLVILHYCADGSVEEILPYIYQDNGQYYAAFVLTSFSDFVMTQKVGQDSELLGDADGDGCVDSWDATQILKYDLGLIGAEELNLAVCDVDGDGYVDSWDATQILKYDLGLIPGFDK